MDRIHVSITWNRPILGLCHFRWMVHPFPVTSLQDITMLPITYFLSHQSHATLFKFCFTFQHLKQMFNFTFQYTWEALSEQPSFTNAVCSLKYFFTYQQCHPLVPSSESSTLGWRKSHFSELPLREFTHYGWKATSSLRHSVYCVLKVEYSPSQIQHSASPWGSVPQVFIELNILMNLLLFWKDPSQDSDNVFILLYQQSKQMLAPVFPIGKLNTWSRSCFNKSLISGLKMVLLTHVFLHS